MIEIHRDARWNPWVEQDRAEELEWAMATIERWTRAKPGHRVKTEGEVEAMLAEWDASWKAESKAREAARQARKAQYDEGRESARLRPLEVEAHPIHSPPSNATNWSAASRSRLWMRHDGPKPSPRRSPA
ncbi:MAG: hypothetical protein JWO88_2603 [Frankiales bacterium]|nr:hypothetical protein [Frankiales bacterium]